jgi:hypothetical protein
MMYFYDLPVVQWYSINKTKIDNHQITNVGIFFWSLAFLLSHYSSTGPKTHSAPIAFTLSRHPASSFFFKRGIFLYTQP